MEVDQCHGHELKRPTNEHWYRNPAKAPIPTRHEIWDHLLCGIRVISTIEFTSESRGVEWHLSVSERGGKYPGKFAIEKALKDFGATDFESDDHGSTVAHFWLPVEKDKRGDCDCKD